MSERDEDLGHPSTGDSGVAAGGPSPGQPGILLMMNLCDEVNVYEFLPSTRQSDLCYYYERYYDRACTVGGYHPLMYEKNLVMKLNQGDMNTIHRYGKATLPGIKHLKC